MHMRQPLVLWKERLNILWVEAGLAGDHTLAGGTCQFIAAIWAEGSAAPERQHIRAGWWRLATLGHKGVACA